MAKEHSSKLFILAVVFCFGHCLNHNYNEVEGRVIQILEDNIDSENFTYYRLQRDGHLRLELTSMQGDVDIYASSKSQYPSYTDYELKSATCGFDSVSVSDLMPRPVYIAIYGHPNYLHSKFRLVIYLMQVTKVIAYEDLVAKYESYYFDEKEKSNEKEGRRSKSEARKTNVNVEEDHPLWLKILLGIIEFVIDNL